MNISGSLSLLSYLLFGLAVLYIVWIVAERQSGRSARRISVTVVLILIVGGLLATLLSTGLVFIEPEERGVVISALSTKGYRSGALTPGLHWIVPYAERVQRYSISQRTYTMSGTSNEGDVAGDDAVRARTNDGQEVFIDASVIFSIDPVQVPEVHIRWQERYVNDLVRPQVRGIIRDEVAKFSVEEVYSTKRDELHNQIEARIQAIFAANGLMVRENDFILRNVTFTPEYADAIEQKQIAEQNVQRAKFLVEQQKEDSERLREEAKGKKDAAITQAEGEAEAIKIRAEAEAEGLGLVNQVLASNPDLLQYKYIEELASDIEIMLLPANSPYLFNLPSLQPNLSSSSESSPPTDNASP